MAIKLMPPGVLAEHRGQAQKIAAEGKVINRTAAVVVVILWVSLAVLAVYVVA